MACPDRKGGTSYGIPPCKRAKLGGLALRSYEGSLLQITEFVKSSIELSSKLGDILANRAHGEDIRIE
jgi:hypothetical protein